LLRAVTIDLRFLERRRRATQSRKQEAAPYASAADFCRIFIEDMGGLYLLSLLLTGKHSLAEHYFLRSLEESREGNPVFKEWTQSWARRKIIQHAIQKIRPKPTDKCPSSCPSDIAAGDAMATPAEIANIFGLPEFERFVFVMSVLERYSFQECALLLGCTRSEIVTARTRALQQIAKAAELPRKVVSIDSDDQGL